MVLGILLLQISLCSAGYAIPEQIHLSWTENANEMRITWVTYLPLSTSIYYRSLFCKESSDWSSKQASYKLFDAGDMFIRLEFIHTVTITISSDCIYEYYAGSYYGWSETYQFRGLSPGSKNFDPIDMLLVADWGGGTVGQMSKNLILKQITLDQIDGILHAGDLAYDLQDLEGMVGDSYLNMIQPISARIPYMAIPGNHEHPDNYTHFKKRFNMPINEANQGTGYFFSFDLGRAHFIMLNTEVIVDDDKAPEIYTEINWLKNDLKKANENRDERPWIIALTHRNLYCSVDWTLPYKQANSDCGVDSIILRRYLEDLLYQEGVDLFFQAHVHQYERNSPIYKNHTVKGDYDDEHKHVNPKATIYITNGNAGNIELHNDPISKTPQNWSIFATEAYGYGKLQVFNKTHVYYQQYSSGRQTVIDHLWVIKDKLRF
ncbi:hypothetical protein SteCoe_11156 [Stentor coeruleus]|uniref:Purple acid phosphatase n=1 Tax=Stentor coeruleus TaxID=5963 RepID=A0A1R2CDR9_9CILI|nr:hypothetical protein SteCoe_11156 [Stentor coeruleus]